MRAITINEDTDKRLKIYMNKDGSYDAVRNSNLYNFQWNWDTHKIYGFKKIGTINDKYALTGKLISKPHIQMIIQVQRNIGSLNEGAEVLKPKTREQIEDSFFRGPGFYTVMIVFDDKSWDLEFMNIENKGGVLYFLQFFFKKYENDFDNMALAKINTNQESSVDWNDGSGIHFYGTSVGAIEPIVNFFWGDETFEMIKNITQ
ncbi:MAG: hypothetical protein GYA51_07590 [Candidatus Methanofastidiosa archaeon]|jgi:hypothetical protein|nr:hypothetical protein [Candidatus Methanofastidiosa archaeon]